MQSPTVTASQTLVTGRKFSVERLTIHTPAGKSLEREVIRHPGAVVVVPIMPDRRIVLVRVFRHALAMPQVECCAGTLDPRETPERCAARELIEETGYEAASLIPLASFWTTPGMTDERMHAFVASGLTHVGQKLEEDESIEVLLVEAGEALAMVERGEISDGKSMLALMLAERRGLLR